MKSFLDANRIQGPQAAWWILVLNLHDFSESSEFSPAQLLALELLNKSKHNFPVERKWDSPGPSPDCAHRKLVPNVKSEYNSLCKMLFFSYKLFDSEIRKHLFLTNFVFLRHYFKIGIKNQFLKTCWTPDPPAQTSSVQGHRSCHYIRLKLREIPSFPFSLGKAWKSINLYFCYVIFIWLKLKSSLAYVLCVYKVFKL